ncbi:GNAT family N-acetyltransferase [Aliiruegeria sabulilitoris]|uniref:GNAT family N-acetyltransferase n=1 Tax=Aliiruegeria sabulilitoris TaxID=1510458 RepID=UPI000835551F|nr:GNAT family N-acetyltransferase [Aliiruegeria sabulilitoris]NDR55608.1 GNAT family N-acetyltransferase [Pseudoruegeria sp. M32A2M]
MSSLRSLGLRSDLMVLRGVSVVEDHADRIVLRTPSQPDFWCGNMVIFRAPGIAAETQIAQFRADFPEAKHVALAWDSGEMPSPEEEASLRQLGFEPDRTDVLTLTGPLVRTLPPEGIMIRPLERENDWAQVIDLQVEIGVSDGFERASYVAYIKGRFETRRRQVAEGWGRWFGAFEGDLLVGDLGIFVGDGLARFQDVEVRESHRRRGICAAMVSAGLNWAAAHDPEALPVILAETNGAAGRIYRRCGFAPVECEFMAIRPPEGAKRPAREAAD